MLTGARKAHTPSYSIFFKLRGHLFIDDGLAATYCTHFMHASDSEAPPRPFCLTATRRLVIRVTS